MRTHPPQVVGLVSGGKDSCYAMYLAMREGHEVVALANLLPEEDQPDELDSYMFQTVGLRSQACCSTQSTQHTTC